MAMAARTWSIEPEALSGRGQQFSIMLDFLQPQLWVDSVLELSVERVAELGREGLILDVDSTLKDYDATEIGPDVGGWLRGLQEAGIKLCLLSNGRPARIGKLAEKLGLPFVAGALKPLPFGCRAAVRKLGLPADRLALVGDQIFADVMAGRLAGVFTILVRPTSPVEPWFTRIKRPFERQLLRHMTIPGRNNGRSTIHDTAK
jgi:putative phosphatase